MAEQEKKTTKKTTTKKTTSDELTKALEMIAKMQEEMEELKKQNVTTKSTTDSVSKSTSRKVKCVSLAYHPVNVSTLPDLGGKIFRFSKYGEVKQIKYDELLDVIGAYPNTMASGLIYICDRDIIDDNGLTEAYENIYDKETMDNIVLMQTEQDANMVLGMSEDLRESVTIKVTELYKNGTKMNPAALAILEENGINIREISAELK